jgi:GT2 family glycosyltransferase
MQETVAKITVIICAYTSDRWSDLIAAVESVVSQTRAPEQIIIVVDHNPDLFERVRSRFPEVTAVRNGEVPGLSGARNSGIAAASGEIVAFLDDDAVAAPNWLENLATAYRDARVIAAGGSIEPCWQAGRPSWFPEEFDWVVGCTYRGMPQEAAHVRNLIGANMSFRRSVFADIGGFRNEMGRVGSFPAGCEETELCIRTRQRWPEKAVVYSPEARISHRVPLSRARPGYFFSRCYTEGTSKALVSRVVGAGDGLSSERSYTFRILPKGVLKGIGDTLFGRDAAGLLRAGAIIAGLACTAAGYAVAALSASLTGMGRRIRKNVKTTTEEYQI